MPNNVAVTACSWNREQGYVAAGGAEGVVKVIKLEMGEAKDSKNKSAGGQTNLVMNQSLDGHRGNIACVAWNDQFDKLTTADINGMIIVWTNHEGQWYEEMINNRNKSVVKSMKWNADGQQICIVYEDGAIIVGSVEGTRIWAKELKSRLTHVEWSPDGRLLLFGLVNGEVHIFDSNGNFMTKLVIQCLEGGSAQIAAIDWYDGRNGFISSDSPALAICYENGRCQIMAHETDEKPVLMDCQMNVVCAQWNHDGSVLAIAGTQTIDDKDVNLVQFYTPWGIHLKSLKVPGKKISTCSWEGGSLRLAITIDSFIFFANLRPDYKWCYFNNTIAYAFNKPGKVEHCIQFYDLKTGESYLKYVKQLISIVAGGDYCALINRTDEESQGNTDKVLQYILVLCNAIGAPLESKYIDIEPIYFHMSSSHIVIASKSYFYFWNYQSIMDHSSLKKQTIEKLIFIDNPNQSVLIQVMNNKSSFKFQETNNPITCVCSSDKFIFIGRESGHIQKYSIIGGNITDNFTLDPSVPPLKIFSNCTSSRLAIIDNSNTLRLMDVETKQIKPEYTNFKRSDVWNVVWATDNPETFVSMEKTKMYIFRDTEPEEPTSCTGYICSFSDLQVKVALLDEIMKRPESPKGTDIIEFDTKSLRDTRELLEGVNLQDAAQFIENNPHQKLWHLLAETALNKLDLSTAEHAYVKCKDYYGLEFVKKIQSQGNQNIKKAEIASYFGLFEDAESTYLEIDRKDLAYQLRRKLGDWFKVLQLLKNGSIDADNSESDIITSALSTGTDIQLEEAYNEIGDYYFERQKWGQAVQYYIQGRSYSKLAECYYILEDYDNLSKILEQLSDNSDLLPKLGQMFESVGMCSQACQAYLKINNVKAAVDTCVRLNQWDEGVRLAKQYNINQVDQLLAKQANNFLQQNKTFNAIELYRKARHYLDAAKLMMTIADKEAKQRNSPLLIKKLYVLTGLLVEQYRDFMKTGGLLANSKGNKTARDQASKALDGLLSEEAQVAINDSKILDNAWRGAEAYHYLMLTQRQLRSGNIDAAFKTSMALMEYEDILESKNIYSLIALCACGNGSYNAASKAFIKLESSESISEKDRKDFEILAFQIFSANQPKDKKPTLRGECPQCGNTISDWCTNCPNCDTKFPPCIVSGRPILEPQFRVCPSCKHRAIESEMVNRVSCPLCHCSVK